MYKKIIISFAVLIVVIGLGVVFFKKNNFVPTRKMTFTSSRPLTEEHLVILSREGFTPQTITIKAGTSVRWKNNLGHKATVNSDNYPTNQLHREMNLGVFTDKSTLMHMFTQPGTYGYHDQFHHELTGTVIVKK